MKKKMFSSNFASITAQRKLSMRCSVKKQDLNMCKNQFKQLKQTIACQFSERPKKLL